MATKRIKAVTCTLRKIVGVCSVLRFIDISAASEEKDASGDQHAADRRLRHLRGVASARAVGGAEGRAPEIEVASVHDEIAVTVGPQIARRSKRASPHDKIRRIDGAVAVIVAR